MLIFLYLLSPSKSHPHPVSTIVLSALYPRKVTLMGSLGLANERHSQATGGQGEGDVGVYLILPPFQLIISGSG